MTILRLRAKNPTHRLGFSQGRSLGLELCPSAGDQTVPSAAPVDSSVRRWARLELRGQAWRKWALLAAMLSSATGCLAEVHDTDPIDTDGLSADALKGGGMLDPLQEIYPPEDPDGPPQMGGASDGCLQACLDQLAVANSNCADVPEDETAPCLSKAVQKYTTCAQACPDDYPDPGAPGFGGAK